MATDRTTPAFGVFFVACMAIQRIPALPPALHAVHESNPQFDPIDYFYGFLIPKRLLFSPFKMHTHRFNTISL